MSDLEDYERSVLLRSRRVGVLWCTLGVIGFAVGVAGFVLIELSQFRRHPMAIIIALGWLGVTASASKTGWVSFRRASDGLRTPGGVPLDPEDAPYEPVDP